jgi:hypothetical protein
MGVLAPRPVDARPSAQPPIDTTGNDSLQVSVGGLLINFLAISCDSKHFSKKKKKKIAHPNVYLPQILFCCDLKPHDKFQNPMITASGRKVSVGEEKRKKDERKNAVNSGHLVLCKRTQAARTNLSITLVTRYYNFSYGDSRQT